MQIRKVVDGLCEWEFKVKLKEAMEEGWEPIDKTMDIVPMANGAIHQYFIVVKREESPEHSTSDAVPDA